MKIPAKNISYHKAIIFLYIITIPTSFIYTQSAFTPSPHPLLIFTISLLIDLLVVFITLEFGIFIFQSTAHGSIWAASSLLSFSWLSSIKYKYFHTAFLWHDLNLLLDIHNWNIEILGWKAVLYIAPPLILFTLSTLFFIFTALRLIYIKKITPFTRLAISIVIFIFSTKYISKYNQFHLFQSTELGTYVYFIQSSFQNSQKPVFKESSKLFQLKMTATNKNLNSDQNKHPDIIVWLHESTLNPDIICAYKKFQKLALFKTTPFTKELSWLRVHTFGGGTWLTEFSLFSGLTSYDFGAQRESVFYTVVPHIRDSFVKNLKKHGYYTIALLPYRKPYKNFYNGEKAYKNFGFDEVLTNEEVLASNLHYGHQSDDSVKNAIIKIWQQHKIKTPVFIYALSLYQHEPYNEEYPEYRWAGTLDESLGTIDRSLKSRMQDYWSRLPPLSQAMTDLEQITLNQRQRPVILASFGDHHPDFDGEHAIKRIWKQPNCSVTHLSEPHYLTYVKIQDNFSANVMDPIHNFKPDYSEDISFLAGKLLNQAHIPMDNIFSANYAMYQLCHGKLDDCPDQKLLASYKSYMYNDLKVYQ